MAWSVPKRILSVVFFGSTPSLQQDQFDFHGAVYVFVGVAVVSSSLIPNANSAFFAVISDGNSAAPPQLQWCGTRRCLAQIESVAVVSRT